jgi:pimeloyl-ACP methyl ester carboxylesterase
VVQQGTGDLVVLLHGFPEFWYSWRHQFEPLASAGFCAVVPDLRGYNESDAPPTIADNRTNTLVADIADLIKSYDRGPACVVGHDWGGLIAWRLAAQLPELVRKLVIMNAAHPAAFQEELRHNPKQWFKSAYTLFFQLPWLPERLLRAANFAALDRGWRQQPANPQAFTTDDISQYKQALSKHGLTPPLNYYRAALRYRRDLFGPPQLVPVPTLVIWGEKDPFMSVSILKRLKPWVEDLTVKTISNAGHWVQNESPELANQALIDFLQARTA